MASQAHSRSCRPFSLAHCPLLWGWCGLSSLEPEPELEPELEQKWDTWQPLASQLGSTWASRSRPILCPIPSASQGTQVGLACGHQFPPSYFLHFALPCCCDS